MMDRSEVWRWSRITWSCPGGMEDRKMLKRTAAPRLCADIILPPFLMPNYIPYSTFVSISH